MLILQRSFLFRNAENVLFFSAMCKILVQATENLVNSVISFIKGEKKKKKNLIVVMVKFSFRNESPVRALYNGSFFTTEVSLGSSEFVER